MDLRLSVLPVALHAANKVGVAPVVVGSRGLGVRAIVIGLALSWYRLHTSYCLVSGQLSLQWVCYWVQMRFELVSCVCLLLRDVAFNKMLCQYVETRELEPPWDADIRVS